MTTPPEAWTGDYYVDYDHYDRNSTDVSTTTTTTKMPDYDKMPPSCCRPYSSYDSDGLRCENYFTGGCHGPLDEILSQIFMMWSSAALVIALVQVINQKKMKKTVKHSYCGHNGETFKFAVFFSFQKFLNLDCRNRVRIYIRKGNSS